MLLLVSDYVLVGGWMCCKEQTVVLPSVSGCTAIWGGYAARTGQRRLEVLHVVVGKVSR
jgi:hypothetical protein